jgi:hypothetical protein
MVSLTPEKGTNTLTNVEKAKLIVSQPAKLQELNLLLESFENLNMRVGEKTGEDRSGDLGASGAGTGQGTAATGQSARDLAIKNLPAATVMQKKLTSHIQKEVQNLQHEAIRLSATGRPGGAFKLNEIYARIRRLNVLLTEIFHASMEALQRLFVRVFIDKQPIL